MLDSDWTVVALMDGALAFAADLLRALARRGIDPVFDMMRLSSYGDGTQAGEIRLLADLARPVAGQSCLVVDDVCETGASLAFARARLLDRGAARIATAVFALKPAPGGAPCAVPDHWAWAAPTDRFLIGYGMDQAGRSRGLPHIAALD